MFGLLEGPVCECLGAVVAQSHVWILSVLKVMFEYFLCSESCLCRLGAQSHVWALSVKAHVWALRVMFGYYQCGESCCHTVKGCTQLRAHADTANAELLCFVFGLFRDFMLDAKTDDVIEKSYQVRSWPKLVLFSLHDFVCTECDYVGRG